MTLYRGPGGTGSATSDADTTLYQDFLNQTIAARDAALQAEINAELAETNAETAETNAETAETNAETAATNAASSASAAASSASSASTSASNASTSASAASTSATASASSASSASSSASAASTSASNAATSETNAASSASSASTSATNAANSASTATTQATNAASSATAAASSASSASTSATNAANSASAASTSATNAANSATAAAASASEAAGYAASINPADLVHISGTETITGAKTFSQTITGSITGNAGTVTNGVYTTGDQTIAGTKTFSSNPILSAGTANGVAYLNGSKVLTTGSALTFDGTNLSLLPSGYSSFGASGSEGMRLTSTGLGIGTSSPGYRLTVVGATSDTTPVANFRGYTTGSDGTRTAILRFTTSDDNNWALARYDAYQHLWNTNGSEKMRLTDSGNLGVGTTNPLTKLHLQDNSAVFIQLTDSGDGASRIGQNGTALTFGVDLANGATERARIDSSGNLLVGTTSQIGRLTIENSANTVEVALRSTGGAGNNTRSRIIGGYEAGGSDFGGYLAFNTTTTQNVNTERARIHSSGQFSTGTTSTNGGQLTVGGSMGPSTDNTSTCANAFYRWSVVYAATGTINTSDAREKTPVRSLNEAEIAAAQQIASEIGAYKWLSAVAEKGDAAREHIGMTVQRAIEIMESNGLTPFNYGFICYDENEETSRYSFRMDELAMFISRGQQAIITALTARVAALESN